MTRRTGWGARSAWLRLGLAAAGALMTGTTASAQQPADSARPVPGCTAIATPPYPLGDLEIELPRLAELMRLTPVRSDVLERPSDYAVHPACTTAEAARWLRVEKPARGLEVKILPLTPFLVSNSAYARGGNDGALWAGRGVNAGAYGGVALHYGIFSAALAPEAIWQQNSNYSTIPLQLPGFSPYMDAAYPEAIDLPQRFGDSAFTTVDAGQSYARVDAYRMTAGVSHENIRWGPALRYALMFSRAGPGFPHVFAGTSTPLDVWIAHVELQGIWGVTHESPYYDNDPTDDRRLTAAVILGVQPRGLDGLTLGAIRVNHMIMPAGGIRALGLSDLISPLLHAGVSPGSANGLASVFARWAMPESGFEIWFEYGQDDFWTDFNNFVKEPDHTRAYDIGFQRVMRTGAGWVRLHGEVVNTESPNVIRRGGSFGAFYVHDGGTSHTTGGQPLGAWIGSGSSAQFLATDLFRGWGRAGLYLERVRYETDGYLAQWARYFGASGYDLELTGGLRGLLRFGDFDAAADLGLSRRYDRQFVTLDLPDHHLSAESNLELRLSLSWWPGRRGTFPSAATILPQGVK